MAPKAGIVVFPGSNCDQDCADAVTQALGWQTRFLWHDDRHDLSDLALLLIPGGFSYGDYLRCGAIARLSPVMQDVQAFAAQGRPVLGICNGFQVLTEAGLLPGALIRNQGLRFRCLQQVELTVESIQTPFTQDLSQGQRLHLPIAHGEGNYTANPATLSELEANGQVVFRYVENTDRPVNGSAQSIAGICNRGGNVLGMMPHPERNLNANPTGGFSGDGRRLFDSLLKATLATA